MMSRLDLFNLRALRRRLEKRVSVWENDGGNVPNEEKYYLVNGHLMTGWLGYLGWQGHRLWKHIQAPFVRQLQPPPPQSHPTF